MRPRPEMAAAAAAFAAAMGAAEVKSAQAETHPAASVESAAPAGHKPHDKKHRPKLTVDVKFEGNSHGYGQLLASVGGETHLREGKKGEVLVGGAVFGGVKLAQNGYAGNQVGVEGAALFRLGKAPVYLGPEAGGAIDLKPGMASPGGEGFVGARFETHVGKNVVLGADLKVAGGKEAQTSGEDDGHGGKPSIGVVGVAGVGGRF